MFLSYLFFIIFYLPNIFLCEITFAPPEWLTGFDAYGFIFLIIFFEKIDSLKTNKFLINIHYKKLNIFQNYYFLLFINLFFNNYYL